LFLSTSARLERGMPGVGGALLRDDERRERRDQDEQDHSERQELHREGIHAAPWHHRRDERERIAHDDQLVADAVNAAEPVHVAAAARAGIELRCLRAPGGRQRTPARRLAEREGIVHPCWYRHPSNQLNPGTIASVSEITDVLAAIGSLAASGRRMALATIV